MRPLVLAVLCATVTSPCLAQRSTEPLSPADAFQSFARLAALIDQPVSALVSHWPAPLPSGSDRYRLDLTAAHNVEVRMGDGLARRDARRVESVTFAARAADTLALKAQVLDIVRRIEVTSGPAERCADPFGPPAYLYAPQRVTRFWSHGVSGHPTRLVWDVNPGSSLSITVIVGRAADNGDAKLACDSKMP
jgi:hypothetical protein